MNVERLVLLRRVVVVVECLIVIVTLESQYRTMVVDNSEGAADAAQCDTAAPR